MRIVCGFVGTVALVCLSTASATDWNGGTATEFAKALAVAQAQVPGGQLITGRAETGAPVGNRFGFYFYLDGRIVEIEISPTGQTLKRKEDQPNPKLPRPKKPKIVEEIDPEPEKPVSPDIVELIDKKKIARAKLPEGRLLEIAGDSLKDTPLKDMKYIIKDGRLVIQVGTLMVDVETGTVISE